MAAAGVDLGYLATHLGMPEKNLATVAFDPTTDLVNAILSAVAAKGHEFDAMFSQKLQLEVELETSVRGAEAQRDVSNETARKALKDVEEIRQKLKEEETTRQSLENELQTIKSSSSTSQSELDTLRARIASLETSNRESLAIIEKKTSGNDELSQELQAQHQKNLKLKQEIEALQQSVQNANNTANASKFREQALQQQLDMAKRSADFYENELKTKSAEALKYRKEKGARITELERLNDDVSSNLESLKRTEQQLRQRLDGAQKKADDALTKIQQLEEAAGRREEDFRQQMDTVTRLREMQEQHADFHKKRVQDLEAREEQVKRDCEDQVRRINEELARVNLDKEELSQANDTLQAEIGRLEAMLAGPAPGQPGSAPQTPRGLNGSTYRSGSPFATPGSSRNSLTATQALDNYYKVKGQLNAEKQRSKNLAKELDEVIEQLEAKGPELEELYAENERLQEEIKKMSHLSDEGFRERDTAKKAARKAESAASQAQAEITILRNQLRDLSAQIQMLLFNMHCREKGMDELSLEEALHFQKLERGQIEGEMSDEPSDVNSMILQRLVVFKDLQEIQEKNEHLLQVCHELGQKMENEEAIAAKNQAVEDHKERIRLEQQLEEFKDTLKGFQVKTESITNERDMFRRIVESRASADDLASALGHPIRDGVLSSIEQTSGMNDGGSEYDTVVRNLRQDLDQSQNEHTIDRKTWREQNEKLSSERNSLQAEVSRIRSQLSLASERYEMLQSNFAALQNEHKELQKRHQTMSESAAKQDIRTQQVAEDLVEAKGLMESMRSENANLKAEKKLWKDIQDRLSQDNENLMQEKSRLNGLLATQQTLQNERDLSESETKRRLQGQIDTLEAELNTTKRKLADEVDESKKAQLRKEFDAQQSQKRIDELTSNLSQIREELVATKTSKDHLQTRVDELTIQLRSAEERAERLQPRPTPRPGFMVAASEQGATQGDTDERIQDLIHEATDLKRDLEMTKSHLENAQTQVERYKELSQASEEELERLNSTQEQYTQEMDASLSAKDATIKELEQRVEDLSSELTRSNSELSTLRDSQAEVTRRFEEEKAILEEEIKRLKDEEERYTASTQFHQQDLRAQAEIATNAQQSYESEVMKHGETAKTLSNLRGEYNLLKTSAASLKAEAESAKATLLQSESSWDERRQRFERELTELRDRRDDANAQNKLLYQQLESVTSQVSALQQTRAGTDESLETISAQPSSSDVDRYREVSNHLRRENEILEVQYDLKAQESRRLQQQLEYAQSQLDEARLKLEQERQSHDDNERSTMAHKDLMSKLDELNAYRASSSVLRAEARQTQAQLTEKTAKVTELESSIQPLEAQIEELQSQQAFKEAEMKQLQEDRDRWRQRTEDILSKHGRTDPAELEELKQTVANLESERNALQEAEAPLKQKIEELEKSIQEKEASWAVHREKLIDSAKERSRRLGAANKEVVAEKEQLQARFDQVNGELSTTKQDLETSKKEKLAVEEQISIFKLQVEALREEARQNATPMAAPTDPSGAQTVSDLQTQLSEVRTELENVSSQKAKVEEELQDVRGQLNTVVAERDQAVSNAQMQMTNGYATMENGEVSHEENQTFAPLSDDERKSLQEKISVAEARATELEAKVKELEDKQDAILKARSDKMKETLNKRLNEYKSQMEEERTTMRQDKERLDADFKLRIEQERKIWDVEHSSAPNESNETKPPSTPQPPQLETPTQTPITSADLDKLDDKAIRDLVFTNTTIKNIVQTNVKNKLGAEIKKMKEEQEAASKSEWELKLTQARDSATQLATSKMNLKINMTENRARTANAKLGVVETAAKETPQRPVGEVWAVAKDARPAPTPKQPAPAAAPATTPGADVSAVPPTQPANTTTIPASQEAKSTASSTIPKPGAATTHAHLPSNPFAGGAQSGQFQQAGANPFGQSTQSNPQQATTSAAQPSTQPAASQLPTKVSGLPVPGARKPSGPNQPRVGARGGGPHRGGRGGAQQSRASLNASAESFQPGSKRPRGDSEAAGNGAKRSRGGGPQ
ncbi:Uu.00g123650.m01.CDS01 [Anthostomella pinea]|uniref:Uu.00g123650.m01.CDS01 n=1 Tax=Anthostomella pinea TaxID=933095 RepID=A0AAI8VHZ0_9PEZI|nr:Uu.00g123650.m01.CDS01 [Anthostomella pinea]